jgi:DNA-binding LacI/PurR family transcriptional regulator
MAALSFFADRRFAIPARVSLICMGTHPMFRSWTPCMSCYSVDEGKYHERSAKLVLRLAKEGSLPGKDYSRIPEYVEGETVAAR